MQRLGHQQAVERIFVMRRQRKRSEHVCTSYSQAGHLQCFHMLRQQVYGIANGYLTGLDFESDLPLTGHTEKGKTSAS